MKKILDALELEAINPGVCSGGQWHDSGDAPLITSTNPSTGEGIASVRCATQSDYEQVIAQAQEAFSEWRMIPAPQRGDAVRIIGNALRRHKDALGSLVTLEMGKIKSEGDGEVQEMIDIADFSVGQSRMLYGRTMHSERPLHRLSEQWHPLGIVGVISAFNFPVAVWSWNAFIAAICGNITIWKPSPKTPLCSVAIQKICNQTLADAGYPQIFSLINSADQQLIESFVDDPRIQLISFTGSTAVGKVVGQRVAARMGKSLLELGGNNALIVDEHANMDLVIPAVAFGAVGTAGQRCTTTRRVLVHRSRLDELSKRLVSAYRQVRIGDPLDPDTLMGPLIDESSVARYEEAVCELKDKEAEILCGGNPIDGPGNFVEPTIAIAENDWPMVQRETFAPILYIIPCDDLDDALNKQNAVAQGLSSSIFTDQIANAERFLSHAGSDCGIANVNVGTSGAEIGGAFGGEKETGGGREAGSDSWKAYMRRQTNTVNWGKELPLAQGVDFSVE